jgi:hypothetical protein
MLVNPFFSFRSYGAEGQNRTADTGIFSHFISHRLEIDFYKRKGTQNDHLNP